MLNRRQAFFGSILLAVGTKLGALYQPQPKEEDIYIRYTGMYVNSWCFTFPGRPEHSNYIHFYEDPNDRRNAHR